MLTDNVPVWSVPKSPSGERLRKGGASAEPSLTKTNSLQNAAEVKKDVSVKTDGEKRHSSFLLT